MAMKSFVWFNGLTSTVMLLIVVSIVNNKVFANVKNNEIHDDEYMYRGVKVYEVERECAMLGGLCVKKTDCSQATSKSGLCPKNQHRGVECCYEVPIREAPCSQHLGMCMPHCNQFYQRPATDCPNNQVCCVLV